MEQERSAHCRAILELHHSSDAEYRRRSQFSVVVTNLAGAVASNSAIVTVKAPTLILSSSTSSLSFGSVTQSHKQRSDRHIHQRGHRLGNSIERHRLRRGFQCQRHRRNDLGSGQSAALNVTFDPATTGSVTGTVTVASNATSGANVIALSGTGAAPPVHAVSLIGSASTSTVVGYNVYVSMVSGGGYMKLTPSPVASMSYIDSGLQTAQTRYYVVTSVDSNNDESGYSTRSPELFLNHTGYTNQPQPKRGLHRGRVFVLSLSEIQIGSFLLDEGAPARPALLFRSRRIWSHPRVQYLRAIKRNPTHRQSI